MKTKKLVFRIQTRGQLCKSCHKDTHLLANDICLQCFTDYVASLEDRVSHLELVLDRIAREHTIGCKSPCARIIEEFISSSLDKYPVKAWKR